MKNRTAVAMVLLFVSSPHLLAASSKPSVCSNVHQRAEDLCNPDKHHIASITSTGYSAETLARARVDDSTKLLNRSIACTEARQSCEDECTKAYALVAGTDAVGTTQMHKLECTESRIFINAGNFERQARFAIAQAKIYANNACALKNGKYGLEKSEFCEDVNIVGKPARSYSFGRLPSAPVPNRMPGIGPPASAGDFYGLQFTFSLRNGTQ